MTTHRAPSHVIPKAFPGITPEEVQMLISHAKIGNYSAGTVVCLEGALENTFYVILDGELEVTKRINDGNERLLSVLRAGDFFGEMALIHNTHRAATVRALTNVVLMEIGQTAFEEVLHNSNTIALTMVRKISERLRENDEMAIEDLRLRASELAAAYQKLAEEELARREFLTHISHELRTPLTATLGYLQLLSDHMVDPKATAEAARIISKHLHSIVDMVNDIFFMQELDLILPDFQPLDLREIVRAAADALKDKSASRHIKIKVKVPLTFPKIKGAPSSLQRALTSLLDNAIKFSYPRSKIIISLKSDQTNTYIFIEPAGLTIEPAELPKLFDRYYQPDTSPDGESLYGGLGIGMAIAKQVVEQHHGQLRIEQTPKGTSIFVISLPIKPAED